MTRPLRSNLAGAYYHVTSRGNARQEIFPDEEDRRRWLGYLPEWVERYQLQVQRPAGATGGEDFVEQMRGWLQGDFHEQGGLRQLRQRAGWEEIKGEPWEAFKERRGDRGRDVVLWLAPETWRAEIAGTGGAGGRLGLS